LVLPLLGHGFLVPALSGFASSLGCRCCQGGIGYSLRPATKRAKPAPRKV
jgi:hypothetical protein